MGGKRCYLLVLRVLDYRRVGVVCHVRADVLLPSPCRPVARRLD